MTPLRGSARPAARRFRSLLRLASLLALAAAIAGCATRIHPPARPEDPVTVVLLDFGRTPGLALPRAGETVVYVYGDWNFYALRNTGPWDGLRALFWPTRGALGRRVHDAPIDSPQARDALRRTAEHLHPLRLPRQRVEVLRRRLDALFDSQRDARVVTPSVDLEFVPHPQRYSALRNSNRMIADWLVELGCQVHGTALLSDWRVVEPAGRDGSLSAARVGR